MLNAWNFFFGEPSAEQQEELQAENDQDICMANVKGSCLTGLVESCVEGLRVDVTKRFQLVRMLGGGKSGAYLFIVSRGAASRYVLKYYPGAFAEDGSIKDQRPFREIAAVCKLSGVQGFPCLYSKGCMSTPTSWFNGQPAPAAKYGPYIVSSIAAGVALQELDLHHVTDEFKLGISLKLLAYLKNAQRRLGQGFEHFDLHTDNIFVDTHQVSGTPETFVDADGEKFRISSPVVTIIDFDLVSADYFTSEPIVTANEVLKEHTAKREGVIPIPERTLTWAKKWLPTPQLLAVLQSVKKIHNTDIRNWYIISLVLVTYLHTSTIAKNIVLCTDPTSCLVQNSQLFSRFTYLRARKRNRLAPLEIEDEEDAQRSLHTRGVKNKVQNVVLQLLTRANITQEWLEFEDEIQQSVQRYVDLDKFELVTDIALDKPISLVLMQHLGITNFQDMVLSIRFKQLNPTIVVQFPTPLLVGVNLSQESLTSLCQVFVAYVKGAVSGSAAVIPQTEPILINEAESVAYVLMLQEVRVRPAPDVIDVVVLFRVRNQVVHQLTKLVEWTLYKYANSVRLSYDGDLWKLEASLPMSKDAGPCDFSRLNVTTCRTYLNQTVLGVFGLFSDVLSDRFLQHFRALDVKVDLDVKLRDSSSNVEKSIVERLTTMNQPADTEFDAEHGNFLGLAMIARDEQWGVLDTLSAVLHRASASKTVRRKTGRKIVRVVRKRVL